LIIFSICLVTVIAIICYKRIVNKTLETSLNEKIQKQTAFSLGQYREFKDNSTREDESTGRKVIDVTKL
jgi:hypothetical protein